MQVPRPNVADEPFLRVLVHEDVISDRQPGLSAIQKLKFSIADARKQVLNLEKYVRCGGRSRSSDRSATAAFVGVAVLSSAVFVKTVRIMAAI